MHASDERKCVSCQPVVMHKNIGFFALEYAMKCAMSMYPCDLSPLTRLGWPVFRAEARMAFFIPAPPRSLLHLRKVQWRFARSSHVEDVFVCDFDGVLCDSQGEVMSAGLAVARSRWPDSFSSERALQVQEALNRVRPRLISGFESVVMARHIAEEGAAAERDILLCADWPVRLKELIDTYGASAEDLQREFEAWRRSRIENDFEGWLGLNPLYEGVKDALEDCRAPVYFASSKNGTRLVPLLRELLDIDVDVDSPRVLHTLIPPNVLKLEALRSVAARPVAADSRTQLHFIDDRFETLEYVLEHAEEELLNRYTLYLASWGYATPEEIARARMLPGVRVLTLADFCELLRFGLVMNVDDGCQDTEEEARENVLGDFRVSED